MQKPWTVCCAVIVVAAGLIATTAADAKSRNKLVEIGLKAHPEGLELEPGGKRVFVNVTDAREIADF